MSKWLSKVIQVAWTWRLYLSLAVRALLLLDRLPDGERSNRLHPVRMLSRVHL